MKKYIKSLAILLTLSLGFAACSEDEVEQVTYASAEEIASWASETAGSKDTLYDYNIALYVNQTGDTLCTFTRIDKKTGNEKYLRRGVVSYDKLAGMTTVVFPPQEGYPTIKNMKARLYLARHRDMSRMTVQLFKVSSDDKESMTNNFTAVKTSGFCISEINWYINGDKNNKELGFKLVSPYVTKDGKIINDDATVMVKGKNYRNAKYQWDRNTGTGFIYHAASGAHVDLSRNDYNQLVAGINDTVISVVKDAYGNPMLNEKGEEVLDTAVYYRVYNMFNPQ